MSVTVNDHLKDSYDHYYDGGISEWRWISAKAKAGNIVSLCDAIPHDTILEIGAGEGSILKRLSEHHFGRQLFALEISTSGVEAIRQRNIPELVECRLFDGYDVPYENRRFDLAVLSHVVEHVEHPRRLLYEATRVANHVFVEVPLENTLRMSRDYTPSSLGHINFYSPKTIRRLLQTCNLQVIDQRITHPLREAYWHQKRWKGIFNYWIKDLLLKVSPSIATSLFTYNSALIAKAASDQ